MSAAKIGDRVFAVLSANDQEIHLFGFGKYVGDEVPPKPVGFIAALFGATWEEVDEIVEKDDIIPPEQRPMRQKNPKIVLDDGRVVWGAECWWAPEDQYASFKGSRREVKW